jgi:hypothetical protein
MMERMPLIKGVYRDMLLGDDGKLIYNSGWVSNTIMNGCRTMLARFMKNDPYDPSNGIQYLAVGSGSEEWDDTGAPAPDPAAEDLVARFTPTIPYADLNLVYLDENDTEVTRPTNRLQLTATLSLGYPTPGPLLHTYPLREFGLFGSFNGIEYMINYIRHPVIHKDESATLIREIRLYF